MPEAFRCSAVTERLPSLKIESIASFDKGGRLLVGTAEGVLLDYEIKDGSGNEPASVTLRTLRKNFSKKPIEQLAVLESLNIFICLTDAVVNIHDISTGNLRISMARTKGANLFAVDPPSQKYQKYRLAVASKKRLILFEWQLGDFIEKTELSLPDKAKAMVWCEDRICAGFQREYILLHIDTGDVIELFPITRPNPIAILVPLPNKDQGLLLAKDTVSIFNTFEGKSGRKFGLSWSEPPEALAYSFPYVLAIVPKGIEVRTIETQNLVQTIALPKPRLMTEGNIVYVASQSSLWRLSPVSLKYQLEMQVEDKEFEEALNILEAVPDFTEKEREEKRRSIRRLHAFHLFSKKNFEKAMSIFQDINYDPTEVIGLFPDLLPNELRSQLNFPFKMPNLEGQDLEKAHVALVKFLTDRRTMLSKLSNQDEESYFVKKNPGGVEGATSFRELGQIIDTTLLKAYLLTNNNALVGSLLRLPNLCHPDESEKMLLTHKKYSELVELYYGKGLHRKALMHLKKHGEKPNDVLSGTQPTINYLKKLGPEHIDLIIEFSAWVLQQDPVEGMKIFMDEYSNISLPREKVLKHLRDVAPGQAIAYLEFIVNKKGETGAEFHNQLVLNYLESVKRAFTETVGDVVEEPSVRTAPKLIGGADREKLLRLLESSTHYAPEKMLSRFPQKALYEERAVLLSRIGQHDQALIIYAHKLKSPELAERYCQTNSSRDRDSAGGESEVYLELLKVYLQPPQEGKRMVDEALHILTKYAEKINPAKALQLLPSDLDVKKIYPFIEAVLRANTTNNLEKSITKNLLKSEMLQVQDQRIHYQSRRVVITQERMCPVCTKRIGNSAFACYPNGTVIHLYCKDRNM